MGCRLRRSPRIGRPCIRTQGRVNCVLREIRAETVRSGSEEDDQVIGTRIFHDVLAESTIAYLKSCLLKGMILLLSCLDLSNNLFSRSVPASSSLPNVATAKKSTNVATMSLIIIIVSIKSNLDYSSSSFQYSKLYFCWKEFISCTIASGHTSTPSGLSQFVSAR